MIKEREHTYPGMPRWVRVFGIIGIVIVLLVAVLVIFGGGNGGHGPGRHKPKQEQRVQRP